MNGGDRRYLERVFATDGLVDIPLLALRGSVLGALATYFESPVKVFVPMFEHAQLFPGVTREIISPVESLGEECISLGGKALRTSRYRYHDKAVSYWVDQNNIVVKRVNSYKRDEFIVSIRDYAHRN